MGFPLHYYNINMEYNSINPLIPSAGHYDSRCISDHYLPTAKARELFKPSSDLGILFVSI